MPSLLQSVLALLGEGDSITKLAELMGGNTDQATAAVDLAVPTILEGIADTAAEESGMDAVIGLSLIHI